MKTFNYSLVFLIIFLTGCEKEKINTVETNSKVLFISHLYENNVGYSLIIMNNDGTDQKQITDLSVLYAKPVISNSGKTVLFTHLTDEQHFELYSIGVDGTNLALIDSAQNYIGSPDWSDDDTKIVYLKTRSDTSSETDVILFDVLLNKKDVLTSSGDNRYPQFFKENRILFCKRTLSNNHLSIYTMNSDGSDKEMIIEDGFDPVLSNDANKIVYVSSGEEGSRQIFTSSSDGTDSQQLTESFLPNWDSGFPAFGNFDPHWTPNGEKIVYVSEINEGNPEIYIMNSDGSNQTRLTNTERGNVHPELSSDGNFILFSSYRFLDLNYDIFIMNINGENQVPLSINPWKDLFPVEVK